MDDLISRQAAIDAISEWGLIDGLAEGQAIEILGDEEKVPSAQPEVLAHGEGELFTQPEIVRCKDCKHWDREDEENGYCSEMGLCEIYENHYCGWAKRRTDG